MISHPPERSPTRAISYGAKNFVGAISTRASDQSTDGHYFWSYLSIHQEQQRNGLNVPTVIGPTLAKTPVIVPFFDGNLAQKEFAVSLSTPRTYKLRDLEKLLRNRISQGVASYFCYDGGLSDFLGIFWLSHKIPELNFIFNFHWADQWIEIIESKRNNSEFGRKALWWMIQNAPPNLRLSAETRVFRDYLEDKFRSGIDVFPIFSASEPRTLRPWSRRDVDVLFLPQRKSEMDFVEHSVRTLEAQGFVTAVAMKPEPWHRWANSLEQKTFLKPTMLPLSAEDYEELLSATRIVVLPYDKPYFQWGSSGKFNEAIAHGCFPVIPAGLAISSQSSGPSAAHEFEVASTNSLISLVSEKLSAVNGNPGLTPITLTDFFDWVSKLSEPREQVTAPISTVKMWSLIVALSTHRSGGISLLSFAKRALSVFLSWLRNIQTLGSARARGQSRNKKE